MKDKIKGALPTVNVFDPTSLQVRIQAQTLLTLVDSLPAVHWQVIYGCSRPQRMCCTSRLPAF